MPLEAVSANGAWRVRVIPANARRGLPAQAALYSLEGRRAEALWMVSLTNPVRPEDIRLSNAGYLVTLDDWGEPGGPNAVTIHGPDGLLRRRHGLGDLLSDKEIAARVDHPLFDRPWRQDAADYFSDDGRVWTLRTAWGKVLRFDLETGEVGSASESTYVLRRLDAGTALYRISQGPGGMALVPALAIECAVGEIVSLRMSAREMGGIGHLAIDAPCLERIKTQYLEEAQERVDVFRAVRSGSGTLRFENPRTKIDAVIAVQAR